MTILICGLGSIGNRHLRILKSLGVNDFVALRSGKGNAVKSESGVNEISDLKELTGIKVNGALITNPTSLHIDTAIEAAGLGIPLFIEKPLGNSLEKSDELKKITGDKKTPVLMGYNLLYHPCIEAIKKFITEGRIGKAISARSQFGTFMPDWHKDEDYKKSYAAKVSLGGGVILTSIHEQNYLTDFFGKVENVKAMEVGGKNLGIDAEEGVEILMKHAGGVVSNIHLNFFQKPYFRNCQVIGTEGTIYWDFMVPEVKLLFKDKTEIMKYGNGPMELLELSYINQMKHFLEIVNKGTEPRINLSKGIEDMRVAFKILSETGRT
ncbi:MAG TPA: Gfo/Idh/MocA family oxidoreductase [Ignavibacteria bacterium]|nr:Gfo/Idh/MocA family oxidoreductase [Ignavibacteria bacterium]